MSCTKYLVLMDNCEKWKYSLKYAFKNLFHVIILPHAFDSFNENLKKDAGTTRIHAISDYSSGHIHLILSSPYKVRFTHDGIRTQCIRKSYMRDIMNCFINMHDNKKCYTFFGMHSLENICMMKILLNMNKLQDISQLKLPTSLLQKLSEQSKCYFPLKRPNSRREYFSNLLIQVFQIVLEVLSY